jgi:hypothetical protein
MRRDGSRPLAMSMYEHDAGCLLEVTDALLGSGVLVMRVDSGKCQSLPFLSAIVAPQVRGEHSIVAVVVCDGHPALAGESLKRPLGLNCVDCRHRLLQMDVREIGRLIHEYGDSVVP